MTIEEKIGRAILCCGLFLFAVVFGYAENAVSIMGSIDKKQSAETSQTRITMKIYPNGDESEVREYWIESFGRGEDSSYMVFVEPRSIRGLRVLELEDDIRVYFPSTGRLRRITGNQKGGSVGGIGGDFSYEDIGSGSYCADYKLSIERENDSLWIIRGIPVDPETSYSHVLFFVNKRQVRVEKVEYYTPEDGHTKTLTNMGFREDQGLEMPTSMVMVNHKKTQKTEVVIDAARYNISIDEKYFHPNRFYR